MLKWIQIFAMLVDNFDWKLSSSIAYRQKRPKIDISMAVLIVTQIIKVVIFTKSS